MAIAKTLRQGSGYLVGNHQSGSPIPRPVSIPVGTLIDFSLLDLTEGNAVRTGARILLMDGTSRIVETTQPLLVGGGSKGGGRNDGKTDSSANTKKPPKK